MVPSNVSAEALRKAAQDKHSRHLKQFDQHLDYVLLYPDQTIVQNLPGSSVPFTLNKYKEELGKPFSRLYFWLSSTSDIQSCIDFLEEESDQSSEPGTSYISDTVTTASEAKEREGSSRASSCQVKTSPSTNGAVSKTSYPPRGGISPGRNWSTCRPLCLRLGWPCWRARKWRRTRIHRDRRTILWWACLWWAGYVYRKWRGIFP